MKKLFTIALIALLPAAASFAASGQTQTLLSNTAYTNNATVTFSGDAYVIDVGNSDRLAAQLTHRMLGVGTNTLKITFERSLDKINWSAGPIFGLTGVQTNLASGASATNFTSVSTNYTLNGDRYWRLKTAINDNAGSALTNIYLRYYINENVKH